MNILSSSLVRVPSANQANIVDVRFSAAICQIGTLFSNMSGEEIQTRRVNDLMDCYRFMEKSTRLSRCPGRVRGFLGRNSET